MATNTVTLDVPTSLVERFTQQESTAFQLVRERGDVRLWKSKTAEREAFGQICRSYIRYHITKGEKLLICHMPDFRDNALPNFEHICRKLA